MCVPHQVVHLDNYHGLLQYIDESSLTSDLGGSLVYDHQEWVKYRLVSARTTASLGVEGMVKRCWLFDLPLQKVEPFMSDCKSISCHLSTVIDDLNSELPLTAAEAESAMK